MPRTSPLSAPLLRTRAMNVAAVCVMGWSMASSASAQDGWVAEVDRYRVLNQSERGRAAQARLRRLHRERQDELDRRRQALEELAAEIREGCWSESNLQRAVARYQAQHQALMEAFERYEEELRREEQAAVAALMRCTDRFVAELRAAGTEVVVTDQGAPVEDGRDPADRWFLFGLSLDRTDDAIRYCDAERRDGRAPSVP